MGRGGHPLSAHLGGVLRQIGDPPLPSPPFGVSPFCGERWRAMDVPPMAVGGSPGGDTPFVGSSCAAFRGRFPFPSLVMGTGDELAHGCRTRFSAPPDFDFTPPHLPNAASNPGGGTGKAKLPHLCLTCSEIHNCLCPCAGAAHTPFTTGGGRKRRFGGAEAFWGALWAQFPPPRAPFPKTTERRSHLRCLDGKKGLFDGGGAARGREEVCASEDAMGPVR